MGRRDIENRLEDILARATGWLPANELADMVDLVRHGEPGIALENFCTQLEEYDIVVPEDIVEGLRSLASAMGMMPPAWIERAADA
jgi:hypothetical protein